MMLAYVFWHWKQPSIDSQQYEQWLRAFHQTLAAAPPPGFVRSFSYAIANAPWAAAGQPAYEDWYLVRDSAALDVLNDAAISAQRQAPHDTIAGAVAGGTAGLYRLRQGDFSATPPRFASWLAKPAGMPYDAFFAQFHPIIRQSPLCLWGRQMVLGPTPEFCLHSPEPLTLPKLPIGWALELRLIWPVPSEIGALR
jgi:hypothetical protein